MTKRPLPPTEPTMRPPPIMLHDLPSPWPKDIDAADIYITIPEFASLVGWSETLIRKLVNGRFLYQQYRGIVRLQDAIQCSLDYAQYGKGREVNNKRFAFDNEMEGE